MSHYTHRNSTHKIASINSIVDHVMDKNTQLNPDVFELFDNLEKDDKTPTTKRLYNEMNSSSSSNDQTPKRLMKLAYNNSDTVDNKLDYLLEIVQKLDDENAILRKDNDINIKQNYDFCSTINRQSVEIQRLVEEIACVKKYAVDYCNNMGRLVEGQLVDLKIQLEDKTKNVVITNNDLNMICWMPILGVDN